MILFNSIFYLLKGDYACRSAEGLVLEERVIKGLRV